jgi:hypothetical protein
MLVLIWPSDWSMLDEVIHLVLVLIVEWWNADDHFVHKNSESPPIQCVVMTTSSDHFGC